jgi:hypothetical protein
MLTQENTNEAAESGDEVFKKEWSNIKIDKLFTLSGIKDFDELEMWSMYWEIKLRDSCAYQECFLFCSCYGRNSSLCIVNLFFSLS